MKIFIPKLVQDAIEHAPDKSTVLGTLSPQYRVATVTGLVPAEADPSRFALQSGPLGFEGPMPMDATRQTLAVIGEDGVTSPFRISRNSTVSWTDKSGTPVDVQVYDTDQFFKRTPFAPEVLGHLQQERVLVAGMGSMGAPMGLELAMSGVGFLIALDKDVLEIHNCMRHVLGPAYVGWPKPAAFEHHLEEHVSTCKCLPVYGDVFKGNREPLRRMMEETKPTRILAATDSLRIQYLCQRVALHYQIPLMAVWCDNNAIEGEIFMWEPGEARAWTPGRPERGCYACMRNPDEATITRSSTFDYSSDDPDSYGGEPALGTFINRINNIATIIMTAWMLRDCPSRTRLAGILDEYYEGKGLQYIRLGGPYPFESEGQITAKRPWAVEWYRVLKRDECNFCSDRQGNEEILFPMNSDDERPDNWANFGEV